MALFDFMSKTISIQDLQSNAPSIIDEISRTHKEKIIIHNNALKAVIISEQMYEDYLNRLNQDTSPGNNNASTASFSNSSYPNNNSSNSSNDSRSSSSNGDIPPFEYDGTKSMNDIARDAFDYMEKYQLLNNDTLYNLTNALYCHDMFGLGYPLLKRIHNRILLSTEIVIDSQVRYWKQVYTFNNKFYVLYSLLYDKQKNSFADWLTNTVNIKKISSN